MAGKRRLRARAAWQDDMPPRRLPPARPVPLWCKYCATFGLMLFWLYYLGWMGPGGRQGLETGFSLFGIAQVPLLWFWLRGQMGRWY